LANFSCNDGKTNLYNLKSDIGERNDLAATMPDQVTAMKTKLHAWYKDVDAKFLQPKPDSRTPWRPADTTQ
jgi:hypothetical protein